MEGPSGSPTGWEQQAHARLLAGEPAALTELYDQFADLVYGLAARVTGDRAAAEDVTQEVFLHLWERPMAFDPDRGPLRAWLAMLAHRRAVDWVRRAEARRRHAAQPGPPPSPDPEETAVAAAVARCIHTAIDELPTAQRAAILLAYFEGRTYRQVAEDLGVPEGTAKSRLRLGLRRIADRLEAEGLTRDP